MSKISASRLRQRPISRAKKCSVWHVYAALLCLRAVKLSKTWRRRRDAAATRQKETFSSHKQILSRRPLWGNHRWGWVGVGVGCGWWWCCFLFRSNAELPLFSLSTCALLSPPCCTIMTSPSAVNKLFPLFHHPCTVLSSLLSFPSLLPQSSLPSFLITPLPPFPPWQNSSGPCIDQPNRRR